ncbi:hypothetical protein DERP_005793 [Dermatophagoides pteronyssinus]|uniref:Uncharacterized protein n=1 Tax=Dermatophagoides pteronyssinus TaxID=6956 RepID=A0ABQ8J9M1_DERPT|nr:hypothetical protein DERP_005793 [Dermatophagoides pteronyssinus]
MNPYSEQPVASIPIPPPPPPPPPISSVLKSNSVVRLSKPKLSPMPPIQTNSQSPTQSTSSVIPNNRPKSRVEFSANQFSQTFNRYNQQQRYHQIPIPNKKDYFFTQPYYPYYYRQYYLNNFGGIGVGGKYHLASGYKSTGLNNVVHNSHIILPPSSLFSKNHMNNFHQQSFTTQPALISTKKLKQQKKKKLKKNDFIGPGKHDKYDIYPFLENLGFH